MKKYSKLVFKLLGWHSEAFWGWGWTLSGYEQVFSIIFMFRPFHIGFNLIITFNWLALSNVRCPSAFRKGELHSSYTWFLLFIAMLRKPFFLSLFLRKGELYGSHDAHDPSCLFIEESEGSAHTYLSHRWRFELWIVKTSSLLCQSRWLIRSHQTYTMDDFW